jgi:hypothetical protein
LFAIWFNTLVLCFVCLTRYLFLFSSFSYICPPHFLVGPARRNMSDPTTAEEAAAKAALDSAQSSFFLSSKLIFLLALMVPVALLGNPLLDKTYSLIYRPPDMDVQSKPNNARRLAGLET